MSKFLLLRDCLRAKGAIVKRLAISTTVMVLALTIVVLALITAGNSVTKASGDTNNVSPTTGISTSGASLVVMGIASYAVSSTEAVAADNQSNPWSQRTKYTAAAGTEAIRISYAANPTVNATHTFSTTSGSTDYPVISVRAFNGASTITPFDQENGAGASTTVASLATGTVTPGSTNEVLVSCLSLSTTDTPTLGGSGWSTPVGLPFTIGVNVGGWCSYKIQTSIVTEGATWNWATGTIGAAASIASFKAASGGGTVTPCFRSLLGVGCEISQHNVPNSILTPPSQAFR